MGSHAMEGMSAHVGSARPVGILIGSLDMVAADIVGSQIMGFNPLEVDYNPIGPQRINWVSRTSNRSRSSVNP